MTKTNSLFTWRSYRTRSALATVKMKDAGHCLIFKSNAQRETELNGTVQFSSVSRCALNRRRPATKSAVVAGSSQSGHTCESANQRSVCRWMKTGDDWGRPSEVCRRPSTVLDCQEPATAVAGRRSSSPVQCTAVNWTELNWTIQFSSVQSSSVQFSAVH